MTGIIDSIDRSTRLAGHNRLALLLFRLGARQIFGINVFKVQEVIRRPPMNRVPGAHPLVSGIADIRGRVIPVIDLSLALGGPALGADAGHLIVAEYNRSVQGFLVQAVDRIIHVEVQALRTPPRGPGDDDGSYLTSVTQYGDDVVGIVDVERVMTAVIGAPPPLSQTLLNRAEVPVGVPSRVLVVDDSVVARTQMQKVLGQLGLDCVLLADGRQALQHLQAMAAGDAPVQDRLLMVISDVEMPDMDGYTLTAEIRRDPRLAGLHVILHSSLSGLFNEAMVRKVGADRFIAKFSADELAQGVLDHLESARRKVAIA
ncbi:MAG: chemotaxis protein CheV [Panacagrimonas sp.]